MEARLANPRGFCAGVDRAIEIVERALERDDAVHVLARALARQSGLEVCPDALIRKRRTRVQDGMSVAARQMNMDGAIAANPRRCDLLKGRSVCLIDDVMTSGATMEVATKAVRAAGADHVFVLLLARVEKTP